MLKLIIIKGCKVWCLASFLFCGYGKVARGVGDAAPYTCWQVEWSIVQDCTGGYGIRPYGEEDCPLDRQQHQVPQAMALPHNMEY